MIYANMYHGTDYHKEIQTFKPGKRGYLGPGIYFTSRKQIAEYYASKSGPEYGRIYEVKLNVNNPFIVTTNMPAIEILDEKLTATRESKDSFFVNWINIRDIRNLKNKGYDAIVWKFGDTTEISVLDPNIIEITAITKIEK